MVHVHGSCRALSEQNTGLHQILNQCHSHSCTLRRHYLRNTHTHTHRPIAKNLVVISNVYYGTATSIEQISRRSALSQNNKASAPERLETADVLTHARKESIFDTFSLTSEENKKLSCRRQTARALCH